VIVQAYNDGTLAAFESRSDSALFTMSYAPSLKSAAEARLRKLHLRRRGKWKDYNWGSEATFHFRRDERNSQRK
jgi:hypothetical protein